MNQITKIRIARYLRDKLSSNSFSFIMLATLLIIFSSTISSLLCQYYTEIPSSGLPDYSGNDLHWIDLNGDSHYDVYIEGNYYVNVGDTLFVEINQYLNDPESDLIRIDLNGDGYLDVLFGDTHCYYIDNSGFIVYPGYPDIYNYSKYIPMIDTNNDGQREYVGNYQIHEWPQWSVFDWGDYDKDGDLDKIYARDFNAENYWIDGGFRIQRNEGNGVYTDILSVPFGQDGYTCSSIQWIDFDGDGDLDFSATGWKYELIINPNWPWDQYQIEKPFIHIYQNMGGVFQLYFEDDFGGNIANSEPRVAYWEGGNSTAFITSFISDGHPLSGGEPITKLMGFSPYPHYMFNFSTYWTHAYAHFGDYDNDGDLDLLVTGTEQYGLPPQNTYAPKIKLYRNGADPWWLFENTYVPTSLSIEVGALSEYVEFRWTPPSQGLRYSLRIGSYPGGDNVLSCIADSTGYRRSPQLGEISPACMWKIMKSTFSPGTQYYWSVQSVDNNYRGSPWAAEATFNVNLQADFQLQNQGTYVPFEAHFIDCSQSFGTITSWQWDFDGDGIIDSFDINPIWTYTRPGSHSVSLTVSDGETSNTVIHDNLIIVAVDPERTHYVPTQYLTIQAAINASTDGDYIIVADGTYYENLLIEGKNITLASWYFIDGDSTHIANTIIDGSNAINPDQASTITILPSSGRPVSQPHIAGFTIRSGSGRRIIQNEGGSTIEKRVGGGIYIRQANPMFSYNRIEDNDADDEGGGSYAFQSLPNFGGMVNAAVGIRNPGANYFRNNHADIGSDIYIHGVTTRDDIKLQNCSFEVFSSADTTLSNYWATSSAPLSFTDCGGLAEAISSDVWVATNGNDLLNSGLSPSSPFRTIDHALSMIYATEANPLTIHIASGTYSPSLTGEKFPLQMVKHVSLHGSGTDETFLDAEGSADFPRRVINLDKVEGVQISDLTLMNGFVTLAKNYNGGAIGILNSQTSLRRLIIAGSSSAGNGAGIYALSSTLEADSLDIQYNSALGSGGGIHSVQSALNLTDCQIVNNSVSKNGAGVSIDGGQVLITECQICQNQATGYQSKGGGLSISGTADAILSGNTIANNNADNGAGAYLQDNTALRLDRNRFSNNLADYSGGALFINTSTGFITNNLIANNTATQRGGALYCYSPVNLLQNTIVKNKAGLQGGGLYLNSASPSLNGNIVWGNVQTASDTPNQFYLFGEGSDPEIRYCLVEAGSAGFILSPGTSYTGIYENNLDLDPLFTGPVPSAGYHNSAADDAYSLSESSACVDGGDPLAELLFWPLDLIGNPRLDNGRVDIGAWEKPHFTGPRLSVQPSSLDFGRVNINGQPVSMELILQNSGNQPLQISSLSFETPGAGFTLESRTRDQLIDPGMSQSISISFLPLSIGPHTNTLLIQSNSLFTPIFSVPLSGYGIDGSGSVPSNIQLQVIGDDVHLSWNPVVSDPEGNPFTPSEYVILYSENADTDTGNYFYHGFTQQTSYVHAGVVRHRNKMFYRIIAIDANTRFRIENMLTGEKQLQFLSWSEIKTRLRN